MGFPIIGYVRASWLLPPMPVAIPTSPRCGNQKGLWMLPGVPWVGTTGVEPESTELAQRARGIMIYYHHHPDGVRG